MGAFERAERAIKPLGTPDYAAQKQIVIDAHRICARALFKLKKITASLKEFEMGAGGARPTNGDGFWSDYGAALVASGKAGKARELLTELTNERKFDPLAWHARARFLVETRLTDADRQQGVVCATKANELCNHKRAFVLAMLANAQFGIGDTKSGRLTVEAVRRLMTGPDAQWLSAGKAEALFARTVK